MNLLLDTHVALWAVFGHKRLSKAAAELIAAPDNSIFVSAASVWEIAIKHAIKRGSAPAIPVSAAAALRLFSTAGYEMLAISPTHARAVEDLPVLHGDPFDRLLVAQALAEPLRLVTHDPKLAPYSDTIIQV